MTGAAARPAGVIGIDHVVIAVRDLEASAAAYAAVFGDPAVVEGGPELGYRRAVFPLGGSGQKIELCQPLAADEPGGQGQASRAFRHRLETSGEGIHNLAIALGSVDAGRAAAAQAGAEIVESRHSNSYFVHPRCLSGVLVQFLER